MFSYTHVLAGAAILFMAQSAQAWYVQEEGGFDVLFCCDGTKFACYDDGNSQIDCDHSDLVNEHLCDEHEGFGYIGYSPGPFPGYAYDGNFPLGDPATEAEPGIPVAEAVLGTECDDGTHSVCTDSPQCAAVMEDSAALCPAGEVVSSAIYVKSAGDPTGQGICTKL